MPDIVVAEALTKTFGTLRAVDEVSFTVRRGEIFGFLGPNGAGKTTTINLLTTLMKPTSGRGMVAGFDVQREPQKVRERIGVLFQDLTLDRELTGWENLWIHGLIYGVPRGILKNRIRELLAFVELEDWAGSQVKKYSGGMQRRLQIAAALLHRPEILFLDEPTLGLDPQTRAHIWDYILSLQRNEKVTVFLTTHYMDEAERLCHRTAIIDHGRIIALGSPEELKRALGSEVVYVQLASKSLQETGRMAESLKACGEFSRVHVVRPGEISVSASRAPEAIPKIFEKAEDLTVKIREVTYHMPTLEDVFLHLTGRKLRDEEVSGMEAVRIRHRWR
ncbi:MAG: daunorubicin resistance protein DrrA family ABC transporter ATP-binding protein [Candidatus Hecatellales archaeon B24]|nr:MAG: daunorubicin resistance protein DrrA family ABC transporter ATP-binding protein [Candidatus Hecatellales archaeon B24]